MEIKYFHHEELPPDKGKPVVKRGRKATDQNHTDGRATEGWETVHLDGAEFLIC
jgi:hypothetical protein